MGPAGKSCLCGTSNYSELPTSRAVLRCNVDFFGIGFTILVAKFVLNYEYANINIISIDQP